MAVNGVTKRLIFEAGSIHKQRTKGVGHSFIRFLNPLFMPHHSHRFHELVILSCPFLQLALSKATAGFDFFSFFSIESCVTSSSFAWWAPKLVSFSIGCHSFNTGSFHY